MDHPEDKPGASGRGDPGGPGSTGTPGTPFPSTEAAVAAIREVAERHGHTVTVEHAIGADESSRRFAAGAFAVTDEDGSLPHEALLEIPAAEGPFSPHITVQVFQEGDAHLTLDGITFHDIPREQAPAFLETVFDGRARVKLTWWPPYCRLIIALPGDRTYKETVPMAHGGLSRWLNTLAK